jgi:hypothetical protein
MDNIRLTLDLLECAPTLIRSLVSEIPPRLLKTRPAPDKWSIHEHVVHLADLHPLFHERLDLILREENPQVPGYSPGKEEQEGALLERNLGEALAAFCDDRANLLKRLGTLQPDQWHRTGVHPHFAPYSVLLMFRHLALHDQLHAYRIEGIVLKQDRL